MRLSRTELNQLRSERAGCLELRIVRSTHTLVGLYRASLAGMDSDGGEFVTCCEEHGTLCSHTHKSIAYDHLPSPESWCDECRATLAR